MVKYLEIISVSEDEFASRSQMMKLAAEDLDKEIQQIESETGKKTKTFSITGPLDLYSPRPGIRACKMSYMCIFE